MSLQPQPMNEEDSAKNLLKMVISDLELRANVAMDPRERGIVAISDGIYCRARDFLDNSPPGASLFVQGMDHALALLGVKPNSAFKESRRVYSGMYLGDEPLGEKKKGVEDLATMSRPRCTTIKVLALSWYMEGKENGLATLDEQGFKRVQPKMHRPGWYYDRMTKACWFETLDGRAYTSDRLSRLFRWRLLTLEVRHRYAEKHLQALQQAISLGLGTRRQKDLCRDIATILQSRKEERMMNLVVYKHDKEQERIASRWAAGKKGPETE